MRRVVSESGIGADAEGGRLASLLARLERGLEGRVFGGEGGASLLVPVRERRELDASLRPFCTQGGQGQDSERNSSLLCQRER